MGYELGKSRSNNNEQFVLEWFMTIRVQTKGINCVSVRKKAKRKTTLGINSLVARRAVVDFWYHLQQQWQLLASNATQPGV
jgi:hypothetical protein